MGVCEGYGKLGDYIRKIVDYSGFKYPANEGLTII